MIKSLFSPAFKFAHSASKSFSSQSHAPPLKLFGINGRYASAVYVAASKAGILNKVDDELNTLSEMIKKNKSFGAFLLNPTVPRSEKCLKLGNLLEEGKISHVTRNLFLVLAANGRIGEINSVINVFGELMVASKGIVRVTVFTAEPLKQKHLDALKSALALYTGKDKKVEMSVVVKEEIMGGLQVMIGDKFVDLSVSSRVAVLSKDLETADF